MPAIQKWLQQEIQWLVSLQTASGAIRNSHKFAKLKPKQYRITPYFANFAALALTTSREKVANVRKYLEWYFRHLNWPDRHRIKGVPLYGTIDDFFLTEDGLEIPSHDYDSADSYAATFLTLARRYFEVSGDREIFWQNRQKFKGICDVPVRLKSRDGLTWAKPTYKVKYLMDNCEVFKGLKDAAFLWREVFHCHSLGRYYHRQAQEVQAGILQKLRKGEEFYKQKYLVFKFPAKWNRWYPDVVCQLYPIIFEVLPCKSDLAKSLYQKVLNNGQINPHCDWINLRTGKFPWLIAGFASAIMEDHQNAQKFLQKVGKEFLGHEDEPGKHWNSFEAAWFVLLAQKVSGSFSLP